MIRARCTRYYTKIAGIEHDRFLQYLILSAITLIAAALRFYKLGEWSFWIDEIFTVEASQKPYIFNIYWPRVSLMMIAMTLKWLGISEWSARLVPAVIGILSIPILYFPLRKIFGAAVSLLAVGLLAVSPWHLFWSQNARFYTSLMLLYTLALLAFYWALEKDRPGWILTSLVLMALAAIERFIALFYVPVVVCYLLLVIILPFEKPPGMRAKNLVLLFLPCAAFGLFETYTFLTYGHEYTYVFSNLEWFLLYRTDDPFRLLSFISFNIGISLISFAFAGGAYLLARRSRLGLLLLVAAVLPIGLLLLLNPFMFTKDRYVFLTLSSWVILGAIAVKELFTQARGQGKLLAAGVLTILLADACSTNLLYYKVNNGNRRDWKGAFALVKEKSGKDDCFVAWWPEFGPYYLDREIIAWADIDPEAVKRSGKTFWFIVDSETVWGNLTMKYWVEQNADLIDIRYLRMPDDLNLHIYSYDPSQIPNRIQSE